jgi:ATP-dependent DNA helicase RecG
MMSPERFARDFAGEGDYVEFKQGLSEHKVREAVAAFSNTDGGAVLLGVRDDGQVHGLSADGDTLAKVHRTVAGVHNSGRYDVHTLLVGERNVIVLAVRRRREGFAQLADGRVLVRRGAMNLPLFDSELARFVTERALTRFEATPVGEPLTSADPALVERVRSAYGWGLDQLPSRLAEAGLIEEPRPDARLTVAGALYLLARPGEVLGK